MRTNEEIIGYLKKNAHDIERDANNGNEHAQKIIKYYESYCRVPAEPQLAFINCEIDLYLKTNENQEEKKVDIKEKIKEALDAIELLKTQAGRCAAIGEMNMGADIVRAIEATLPLIESASTIQSTQEKELIQICNEEHWGYILKGYSFEWIVEIEKTNGVVVKISDGKGLTREQAIESSLKKLAKEGK